MPRTSVSSREFISRECSLLNEKCSSIKPNNNSNNGNDFSLISNVKENNKQHQKSGSCCCLNGCNNANGICYSRSSRRLSDANDLRDLLLIRNLDKYNNNNDDDDDDNDVEDEDNSDEVYGSNYEEWDQLYSFPRLFLTTNTNENSLDPFVLQPSLFHKNHVPPTIYFVTKLSEDTRPPIGLPKYLSQYFKWKISNITPNSIRNCISFMKFETLKPSNKIENKYLGSWYKHMLTNEFSQLEEWRKVNHYPGSFHLGRKDKLWFKLKIANEKFGSDKFGNFQPTTFVLPRDYGELCEYWKNSPTKLFIIKPPASARGNGIKVINSINQIPESALQLSTSNDDGQQSTNKKSTMIVQQYISNPCLLENGKKFDLRVYVLLTSVDPLRIYVYDEGLVRFASSKYTCQEDGIIDQYMHLTNYFINKNNQDYQINNDCESLHGCKWTLTRFWRYLKDYYTHVDAQQLWNNIIDIIIKTIICCEGPMTRLSRLNCKNDYTSYELFGFDIILDENFKPWILEVNITPSLKSESDLDTSVKYGVIQDMFNIVGYNLPPVPHETLARNGKLADCNLSFDQRLYTENLTKRDKIKQLKYQKLFKYDFELPQNTNCCSQSEQTSQINQSEFIVEDHQKLNNTNGVIHSDDDLECTKPLPSSSSSSSANNNISDSILNDLTQNDIRVLMLSEDELSRSGHFKRVFPSESSSKYLKYFDKVRYYNLLLDSWEQKYKNNRLDGISRLSNLANFLN